MKKQLVLITMFIGVIIVSMSSCDDDDGPSLTGEQEVYTLRSVSDPSVNGTVTFANRTDDAVLITIQLSGTQTGNSHPSHIHNDNAASGGGIILDLTSVDGASGRSETIVTQLNDGSPVSYDDLIDFDGYVNVHLSDANLATLIAQGDIGQNALTEEMVEYPLSPVSDPSISGIVTFEERVNGEILATIMLDGTETEGDHPAHIHNNSAAQGGGIAIDFNNVSGATGLSKTNISQLNNGTAITYTELLEFNGYVNVHFSGANLGTLIAQGDIGQNVLTGEEVVYELNPVSDPAISGTVTFAERMNGTTLITIELVGTTDGGDHPAHIHNNSAAQGGGIAIDLKNVSGATGKSATSVVQRNDGTAITYTELIDFNGYVNVHLSSANLATLIAQGDIGANAE